MAYACKYREKGRGIPTKESRLLWARSAGRCAFPQCPNRCTDSFSNAGPVLLGEMAHILARSVKGPRPARGEKQGPNRYANLVLLCPYHHAMVDKAPQDFSPEKLREWKADLEKRVENALDLPPFRSKKDLYAYAQRLLAENEAIHNTYGPASVAARSNPASSLKTFWDARKIEQIIPNNSLIVAAFSRFRALVPQNDWRVFSTFRAHADAFAASAKDRLESVPLFPGEFAEMLN